MNRTTATSAGIAALLGWSLNIAVTRQLAEAHLFGMPGLSFFLGGLLLIVFDFIRGRGLPWNSAADPRYWLLGGAAFIVHIVCYSSGVALSDGRDVALALGLVNYFWPALILVLLPAFFPCRVKWGILAAGLLLCLTGVGMAMLWGLDPSGMMRGFLRNRPAFVMMGTAAFLWAFYTNATRKWGGDANGSGWFLALGGLCLLALWFAGGEPLGFSRAMIAPLFLHAAVVNAVCYLLWDAGARRGDLRLLGQLANFLPLGSVLFGAWYLGGSTTPGLWLGGVLVPAGALLCRKGLSQANAPGGGPNRDVRQ